MGNKAMSLMRRPFRNFNIEDRAHKIISQEKPKPAPRHEKEQQDIDRVMKEYPEAFEESLRKNEQLDSYLKKVHVESHGPAPEIKPFAVNKSRPLPLNRSQPEDFEYGVKDPDEVPVGKVSLKNALAFISKHQEDPKVNSIKKIAADTSISEENISNILKYYRVFEVYIPMERKTKAQFAGPSVPRMRMASNPRKQLPAPKNLKVKGET